jgi:hypothetical protein
MKTDLRSLDDFKFFRHFISLILQKDLDALEQYGRRSLIRISGLSERATGDETTTAVRKIMSEIDPDHKPEDQPSRYYLRNWFQSQTENRKVRILPFLCLLVQEG